MTIIVSNDYLQIMRGRKVSLAKYRFPAAVAHIRAPAANDDENSQSMVSEKSAKRNYLTDSVASTFRTLVAGVAALIVNPFVIRSLSDEQYSGWTIALSIGAYVSFAETGIGTAVIRFVSPDPTGRSSSSTGFVSSALVFASLAGVAAMAVVGSLVVFSSLLFGNAPQSLHPNLRVAAGLCMVSGFFGLWTSVANGYFAALHQTVTSALISTGTAIVSGIAMVYVAGRYRSIFSLAATIASVGLLQAGALLFVTGRRSGGGRIQLFRANRNALGSIWSHCLGTGWWSLSMLLIGGLDLFVVARVDFVNVGSYGIAVRLVGLVFGLMAAATTPLMTIASRTAATQDSAAVSRLLLQSTRITNCANALLGGVLFTAAPTIVRFYAGERYGQTGSMLLRLLLIGHLIRQMGGSLGLVMVATGEHRKAVIPPIVEGLTNLAVSIALGSLIGAAGVAIGTVGGAIVSLVLYNLVVFPKLRAFEVRPRTFVVEGVLPSLMVFAPALVVGLLFRPSTLFAVILTTLELGVATALFFRFGLKRDERHAVVYTVRSRFQNNLANKL